MVAYFCMSNVFTAVADTTRRHLLERLRTDGPLPISTLSEGVPISRQAVTKHLRVLEDAGLVVKQTRGRERVHALSGAPLRTLNDWLAPYEAEWDDRLTRLQAHVDGSHDDTRDAGDRHE